MGSLLAHEHLFLRRRDLGVVGLALGFAALAKPTSSAARGPRASRRERCRPIPQKSPILGPKIEVRNS